MENVIMENSFFMYIEGWKNKIKYLFMQKLSKGFFGFHSALPFYSIVLDSFFYLMLELWFEYN